LLHLLFITRSVKQKGGWLETFFIESEIFWTTKNFPEVWTNGEALGRWFFCSIARTKTR
jgi:hypothetical protein